MKPIAWNPARNELLKARRGISFEEAVFHIQAGDILETDDHPNQERCLGSSSHAIAVEAYVYLGPFVESEDEVFMRTIIPGRQATKKDRGMRNE